MPCDIQQYKSYTQKVVYIQITTCNVHLFSCTKNEPNQSRKYNSDV